MTEMPDYPIHDFAPPARELNSADSASDVSPIDYTVATSQADAASYNYGHDPIEEGLAARDETGAADQGTRDKQDEPERFVSEPLVNDDTGLSDQENVETVAAKGGQSVADMVDPTAPQTETQPANTPQEGSPDEDPYLADIEEADGNLTKPREFVDKDPTTEQATSDESGRADLAEGDALEADADETALRDYASDQQARRLEIVPAGKLRDYMQTERYTNIAMQVDRATAKATSIYNGAVGNTYSPEGQEPGHCYPMTAILQQTLGEEGVDTQAKWHYDEALGGFNHHYLETVDDPDDVLHIDPAWQQFLPKEEGTRFDHLPHTLIIPARYERSTMEAHGIPASRRNIWSPEMSRNTVMGYQDPMLEAIFETQGWE